MSLIYIIRSNNDLNFLPLFRLSLNFLSLFESCPPKPTPPARTAATSTISSMLPPFPSSLPPIAVAPPFLRPMAPRPPLHRFRPPIHAIQTTSLPLHRPALRSFPTLRARPLSPVPRSLTGALPELGLPLSSKVGPSQALRLSIAPLTVWIVLSQTMRVKRLKFATPPITNAVLPQLGSVPAERHLPKGVLPPHR
jgi:hypothetical protein